MTTNDAVRGDALREMDVAVAEALGWQWRGPRRDFNEHLGERWLCEPEGHYGLDWPIVGAERAIAKQGLRFVPRYSTDIAAAMQAWSEVQGRRANRGHCDSLRIDVWLGGASAEISDSEYHRALGYGHADPREVSEDAEPWQAAPLALCRALLAATAEGVTPNPRSFVAEPAAPHAVPSEEEEG